MASKFIKRGTNKEKCRNIGIEGNFGREQGPTLGDPC